MMSAWLSLVALAQEDGPIGEVGQNLVSNETVDVEVQRALGLVDIGDCSGTLINRYWVLTAHHCLSGQPFWQPLMPAADFVVRAKWAPGVEVVPTKLVSWAFSDDLDVALMFLGNGDFGPAPIQPLHASEIDTAAVLRKYGRGYSDFASAGPFVFPASHKGEYRTALFSPSVVNGTTYTLEMTEQNTGHGGDSGGPDIVEFDGIPLGIAGVQSTCLGDFVPGKTVLDGWQWATTVYSCDSAPLYPIRDQILAVAQEVPVPDWESPDPDLFGNAITLYGITGTGRLTWNRQEALDEPWASPWGVGVGTGWNVFVDVVPAGGNAVFAAHPDGTLYWYRHDGYTTGSTAWTSVPLRSDWTDPVTIGGGQGVLYTIADDGTLVWHRYGDYMNGANPSSWSGPSVVGWGWDQFESVVSTGDGTLYATLPNGDLWVYHHDGFMTGDASWSDIRQVGNGWQIFDHLVGLNGDQLLGIGPDGTISWYRHLGPSGGGGAQLPYEVWDGPVPIGGGFGGLPNVFALLP